MNMQALMKQAQNLQRDMMKTKEEIDKKGAAMEIYGSELISTSSGMVRSFALCGNATINVQDGKIIFGYETDVIGSAFVKTEEASDVNYYIVNANGVVF